MRLYSNILLGITLNLFVVSAEPPISTFTSPIDSIANLWSRSLQHQKQLESNTISFNETASMSPNLDQWHALAKLKEFLIFQDYMRDILNIYNDTIYEAADFKSKVLKLTFDFQHELEKSQEEFKDDVKVNSLEKSVELNEAFQDVLKEVSENADQLEENLQNNKAYPTANEVNLETVLKLEDVEEHDDSLVTLLDREYNEYILMRPSDTTVIIEDAQLIHDIILIFVVSFVLGWLFSLISLPAFFGYILTGILIGPAGHNLIQELIQVETLAQLGVVLIVFVLGLECSFEKLKKTWKLALGGAVTLLIVIVAAFVLLGCCIGVSIKESVFVGACISLSSTAIVAKCINLEQFDHLYGLLVIQDVILGFLLAILPVLSKSGAEVFFAVFKFSASFTIFGGICFGVIKLIPLMPPIVKRVLSIQSVLRNSELILLGTLVMCMTLLSFSQYLGLGMEIGCFAAGMIIRSRKGIFETSLSVIEPIRDLFSCLFFVSIGLHIYPSFLVSEAALLLTLSIGVIIFKYIATCIALYLFKFDIFKSSKMAIALAQVSEFCFVLASRAKQLEIISRELYYVLLAVTSLTLIATPLLLKLSRQVIMYQPIEEANINDITDSDKIA